MLTNIFDSGEVRRRAVRTSLVGVLEITFTRVVPWKPSNILKKQPAPWHCLCTSFCTAASAVLFRQNMRYQHRNRAPVHGSVICTGLLRNGIGLSPEPFEMGQKKKYSWRGSDPGRSLRSYSQGRIKLFGAPRQWKHFRPLFQAVFLSGGAGGWYYPPDWVKHHASQSQDRNNKYFISYIEFCINNKI
jgi:hypothetical protein